MARQRKGVSVRCAICEWELKVEDCTKPVPCPECNASRIVIHCPCCKERNMVPDKFSGFCAFCKTKFNYKKPGSGFLGIIGTLGLTRCPKCRRKEGVTVCNEYVAASRDDFVTDAFLAGEIYPRRLIGYRTDYLCNCGHQWHCDRVTSHIKT